VTSVRLARLLGTLTSSRVSSRQAGNVKAQIEHLLMRTVTRGGLRAVEQTIAGLGTRVPQLALAAKQPGRRTWRVDLGARTLEMTVVANRSYRMTSVQYRSSALPKLTPKQRRIQAVQQAFYARYMSIGQKAYADSRYRLAPTDRLILLIGELEADVNNGGFDQYLSNKGRRRAGSALTALRTVGARRTARMLEKALAATSTAAERSALDASFYRVPEDLAVLTARHVRLNS